MSRASSWGPLPSRCGSAQSPTPPLTATAHYWVQLRTVGSSVASQTAVLSLPGSPSNLGTPSIAGGKLNLRISGAPGSKWTIQTSSDLVNWVPEATIGTVTLDVTGAANLQSQPDFSKSTFYRDTLLK